MKTEIARRLAVIAVLLVIGGCGTVTTVLRDDSVTVRELKATKTYCQSVPRLYSGVVYDFCVLHGAPNAGNGVWLNAIPWPVADAVFSGVLDTLVLPYTLYRQSVDGNLELR